MLPESIAVAGYGRKALRAAVARLRQLRLVENPRGTARKGIAITEAGRSLLKRRADEHGHRSRGEPATSRKFVRWRRIVYPKAPNEALICCNA
jgi:DNA-binding PadR family transcriptional regulator